MQEHKFLSTIKWKDGYIMYNIVLERFTSEKWPPQIDGK